MFPFDEVFDAEGAASVGRPRDGLPTILPKGFPDPASDDIVWLVLLELDCVSLELSCVLFGLPLPLGLDADVGESWRKV